MTHTDDLQWRRIARCDSAACVEIATTMEHVLVRNSSEPSTQVRFTHEEWTAFIDALTGE